MAQIAESVAPAAGPAGNVVQFPKAGPANRPKPGASCWRAGSGPSPLATLRRAARDLQVSPPLDLDRMAANGPTVAVPAFWARALIQTAARGARLVFHRDVEPMVSATECWLASLIAAVQAEDEDSTAFLTHRFLAQSDRRLAICFARRLADALSTDRAA